MKQRRKILFLSQVYPYPDDGGGKIKTLNTLKALAKKYDVWAIFVSEYKPTILEKQFLERMGIRVTVFYNPAILNSVKDDLRGLAWNFMRGRSHYLFQYTHPPAFPFILKAIRSFLPDIIHVDHLNMAQYLPSIKRERWVLEHHNVESYLLWTRFVSSGKLTRKLYLAIETSLTYLFERKTLKKFDHIFAISKPEADRVKSFYGVNTVTAQPLVYPVIKIEHKRKTGTSNPYLLFIGGLGWPPNEDAVLWFATTMLPLIIKKIPDVEFHVVGKLHANVTNKLLNNPHLKNIFLHGYQKNLRPFLSQADIFVLPFRMGGGVRLKALTAMAAGLPAVSTSVGVNGLDVKPGKEFLLANSPEKFAQAIIKLAANTQRRKHLSKNVLTYMKQTHSLKQNTVFLREYEKVTQ